MDYSWASPQFIYREIYRQTVTADTSNFGFNVLQKEANKFDAQVKYMFLSGENANYIGMAKRYQRELEEQGLLPDKMTASGDIPLYIDVLMAETVKALFGTRVQTMTTVRQADGWVDSLREYGVDSLIMALRGFEPGGASGRKPDSTKVIGSVGTKSQIGQLYEKLAAGNGQLLISKDFTQVYEKQASKNKMVYSIERQYSGKAINAPLFSIYRYLDVFTAEQSVEDIAEYPEYFKNIALDSTARFLLTNYKSGKAYTRSYAMEKTKDILATAEESADTLFLQAPNAYALQYADAVYDIPLNNSQYLYETDCVPFTQLLLSGYLPMFVESNNTGVSNPDMTLRLIEFNTYPSYVMTGESSALLTKSNSRDIFNSRGDTLIPYIVKQYDDVNAILSKTQGLEMLGRQVLSSGISKTVYENGVEVVVNYTNYPYRYGDSVVDARDAGIFKEGRKWGDSA